MASNGLQPGYGDAPAFPATDAPATGADLEELARYAQFRGNLLRGTTAEMLGYAHAATDMYWANTTDGLLYKYTVSGWVSIFALPLDFVNPTVASGWATPSQNFLARRSGLAFFTFNATRTSAASAGAAIATVPAGYRSSVNIYGQAWGLSGAPASIQINYDAASNQVRLGQALANGQAIAGTISWPITA